MSDEQIIDLGSNAARSDAVGDQIIAARDLLFNSFEVWEGPDRETYPPKAATHALNDANLAYGRAWDADRAGDHQAAQALYDRVEFLTKVVRYVVQREAPKFAANPQAWAKAHPELR
jgi:hypothetical protein